jgi:hypothetical protein
LGQRSEDKIVSSRCFERAGSAHDYQKKHPDELEEMIQQNTYGQMKTNPDDAKIMAWRNDSFN